MRLALVHSADPVDDKLLEVLKKTEKLGIVLEYVSGQSTAMFSVGRPLAYEEQVLLAESVERLEKRGLVYFQPYGDHNRVCVTLH